MNFIHRLISIFWCDLFIWVFVVYTYKQIFIFFDRVKFLLGKFYFFKFLWFSWDEDESLSLTSLAKFFWQSLPKDEVWLQYEQVVRRSRCFGWRYEEPKQFQLSYINNKALIWGKIFMCIQLSSLFAIIFAIWRKLMSAQKDVAYQFSNQIDWWGFQYSTWRCWKYSN